MIERKKEKTKLGGIKKVNEKRHYYAGIGSRNTPKEVLDVFESIGKYLALQGFVLRSGGADGADRAFERGCKKRHGDCEIYLPWAGFNNSRSNLIVRNEKAFEIAKHYHPYWDNLKDGAKKLQARNSHQVLGADLKTPSEFIICYTKDGKGEGGTGQALRIAKDFGIPIFDAGAYETLSEFKKILWICLRENFGCK